MKDRHLMARLLAGRNRPTVLEHEELLERVLQQVHAPQKAASTRGRWIIWLSSAATVGAVAVAGLLLRRPPANEFVARGEAAPLIRASCKHDPCRSGDKLVFEVRGTESPGFLAAVARRSDGAII